MNHFGFTISRDNTIDYDRNDRSIADAVFSSEPTLYRCIQCGSCAGTCTAGSFTDYNFRRMHLLMRRGEVQNLRAAVEKCVLCGKCQLVCPRGVNTRNVIRQIRIALDKLN
jgi:heterodisulfide reductase subunit C